MSGTASSAWRLHHWITTAVFVLTRGLRVLSKLASTDDNLPPSAHAAKRATTRKGVVSVVACQVKTGVHQKH